MANPVNHWILEFQAWIDEWGQVFKVKDHSALVKEIFGDEAYQWMEKNLEPEELPEANPGEDTGWQWNEFAKKAVGWIRINYQSDRYCSEFSIDFEKSVSRKALREAYKILRGHDGFQRYVIGDRTFLDRRRALWFMRGAAGGQRRICSKDPT